MTPFMYSYVDIDGEAVVYYAKPESPLHVGDIILSVNGAEGFNEIAEQLSARLDIEYEVVRPGCQGVLRFKLPRRGKPYRSPAPSFCYEAFLKALLGLILDRARKEDLDPFVSARLLRQRRILAGHLREAIIANHVLRAEMRASQIRAGEVASEMMNEISSHRTDMLIKNMEIEKITAERDALELERNELKARLFESNRSRERMVNDIERLSKAANRRRITHIRLGNELFRNRTKEHV